MGGASGLYDAGLGAMVVAGLPERCLTVIILGLTVPPFAFPLIAPPCTLLDFILPVTLPFPVPFMEFCAVPGVARTIVKNIVSSNKRYIGLLLSQLYRGISYSSTV